MNGQGPSGMELRGPNFNLLVTALFLLVGGMSVGSSHGQQAPVRIVRLADLATEASHAHGAAAELFRSLSPAADRIELAAGGILWVTPIRTYLGNKPAFEGSLELEVLGKKPSRLEVTSSELASVTPFEHVALSKIAAFLARDGLS